MEIVFYVVVGVLICFVLLNEIITMYVNGIPPKDKDVLEYLEKVKVSNPRVVSGAKEDCMIISDENPFITTSSKTLFIGCSISGVGVIPRWYKSYKEIKKLYVELGSEEFVKQTKKQKLGL